jgi:hypothetical protein
MITCYAAAWEKAKYDCVLVQHNEHAFVCHPRSGGFCGLMIGPRPESNSIGGAGDII